MKSSQTTVPDCVVFLNKQQVAKRLQISIRSLERMRDRGELPEGVRIGQLIRWPLPLLEKWEASLAK